MYLTVRLLDTAPEVRPRTELAQAARDVGPDICIQKGTRKIWIEAVSPDQGHENNPDRVADWPAKESRINVERKQRRQVELRATAALSSKIAKFKRYRDNGIVNERDLCIIAVSAGQFPLQAIQFGLSPAVTSVYPIGRERIDFNPLAPSFSSVFDFAPHIERPGRQPVQRSMFQDPDNALISLRRHLVATDDSSPMTPILIGSAAFALCVTANKDARTATPPIRPCRMGARVHADLFIGSPPIHSFDAPPFNSQRRRRGRVFKCLQ